MKKLLVVSVAILAAMPLAASAPADFPLRSLAEPPVPDAVPADEVFSPAEIGHALSPPTPGAATC